MPISIKAWFRILFFFTLSPGAWALDEIRIAYPAAGTIVSAQIGQIFEKTDILKRNGFNAKVSAIGTGRELKTAMVSKKAHVILTSEANFVVLLGEGFDARAINSLGSAGRMALVVPSSTTIKSVNDLKGKSIATIFGTSLHQPAVRWAREAGGAKVININQVGTLHAALETGATDAIVSYDPFIYEPLLKDKLRIVEQEPFALITVASGAYVDAHPEAMQRLQKAFEEAVIYMRENRAQVNEWFGKMAKLDVKTIDQTSMQNGNYRFDSKAPVELEIKPDYVAKLQSLGEFLHREKLIRIKPNVAKSIWSKDSLQRQQ